MIAVGPAIRRGHFGIVKAAGGPAEKTIEVSGPRPSPFRHVGGPVGHFVTV